MLLFIRGAFWERSLPREHRVTILLTIHTCNTRTICTISTYTAFSRLTCVQVVCMVLDRSNTRYKWRGIRMVQFCTAWCTIGGRTACHEQRGIQGIVCATLQRKDLILYKVKSFPGIHLSRVSTVLSYVKTQTHAVHTTYVLVLCTLVYTTGSNIYKPYIRYRLQTREFVQHLSDKMQTVFTTTP